MFYWRIDAVIVYHDRWHISSFDWQEGSEKVDFLQHGYDLPMVRTNLPIVTTDLFMVMIDLPMVTTFLWLSSSYCYHLPAVWLLPSYGHHIPMVTTFPWSPAGWDVSSSSSWWWFDKQICWTLTGKWGSTFTFTTTSPPSLHHLPACLALRISDRLK